MSGAIQTMGDLAINQAMGSPSLMNRFMRKNPGQSIDQAAQDFEGMFMAQMLQPMFETVNVNPVFGGGHGEEVMRSFLVQEYGKVVAKNSSFGIAAAVRDEMIRTQQQADANNHILNNGATSVLGSPQ